MKTVIPMKIAITSQNQRNVTGHAGRATRFVVYEVKDGNVVDKHLIETDKENTLHEFFHNPRVPGKSHPVLDVDVIITGSMGPGFVHHMVEFGIEAIMTDEQDLDEVVAHFLDGTLRRQMPGMHHHNHHHHH